MRLRGPEMVVRVPQDGDMDVDQEQRHKNQRERGLFFTDRDPRRHDEDPEASGTAPATAASARRPSTRRGGARCRTSATSRATMARRLADTVVGSEDEREELFRRLDARDGVEPEEEPAEETDDE
jgi:hypothetical protein